MEIHRVILTKAKLAAMPEAERALLLLLGHANNEINVLSKLILMVRKDAAPSPMVDHVEAGQVFIVMRILIGKLHEAWELFKKRIQVNRPLASKYIPQLDAHGATALERLNKHFGKRGPLTDIRNKLSFHYKDDDNLAEKNFRSIPDTEPLEFYMAKSVGNSFYYASELVVSLSAINLTKTDASPDAASALSPEAQGFSELCDIVIKVSADITELFGQLLGAIVVTSLPDVEVRIEQHVDGPKMSTFALPYFFDENDALPVQGTSAGRSA